MKAACIRLWSRVTGLFGRKTLDTEMADEMQAHLEVLIEENVRAGLPPSEARFVAMKQFGSRTQIEERCREEHRMIEVEQVLNDVRYGLRALCRVPRFSITIVATLALGLGVATAVFNLAAKFVLLTPPYSHPEEIFALGFKDPHTAFTPACAAIRFDSYRQQTTVFSQFSAARRGISNVEYRRERGVADWVDLNQGSLEMLGIVPALGRGFRPEEFQSGAANVVILSNLYWKRQLDADPGVLGREILIDQHPYTVVGVLRPEQEFPPYYGGDIYRPLVYTVNSVNDPGPVLYVLGRIRKGVTKEQAEAALAATHLDGLPVWLASFFSEEHPVLVNVADTLPRQSFWLMTAAGLLLLAIATLNAMNLMLVRLIGRARELSIRLALGGSRWRIIRLIYLESFLLVFTACGLVVFAAAVWFPKLISVLPESELARDTSFLNGQTWICLGLIALIASVGVVVAPALRLLRADITDGLRENGQALGETPATRMVRSLLVLLQAAFAVMLLAGTGLMMRTFHQINRIDLGFDPVGKVKVWVQFPPGTEPAPAVRLQLFERLRNRLEGIPGVRQVAAGQDSLLIGTFWGTAQLQMADGTFRPVAGNFVSKNFQSAAGLRLKRGRWLSGKQGVIEVVINEKLMHERFGDTDPIGQSIKIQVSGNMAYPIVGVVGDVRDSLKSSDGMRFYVPDWLYPANVSTLILNMAHDPGEGFSGLVRHAISEIDPRVVVTDVTPISALVARKVQAENAAYLILKVLSAIALILAVVGLFSVISYSVETRRREFGVRLALGAGPAELRGMVMKRGLLTVGVGAAIGLGGSLLLSRSMASLLYETKNYDPVVYVGATCLLLGAAAAACWWPARRAAQTDVATLLRNE